MLKGIAKAVAYYKSPVKTFAVLHPLKALKWGALFLVVDTALRRAPRRARRAGAA